MDEIARLFDRKGRRKFLLEMATGTGKTLLCAALIRRFLMTRNAERVLFIVDRIELAKQTMEDFEVVLPEYKPVLFKTARRSGELLGSSVVVATIQSLMVDRRYREEFTPFYFDLVINDEAHRSIYGDAREVVQFFQATRVGLTATPKAYLKNVNIEELEAENPKALEARQLRDTYHYFGCKPGLPTFRYDIIDAVKDPEGPFLCLPKIFDLRSDITTQALAEKGWAVVVNEQEENFQNSGLGAKDLHAGAQSPHVRSIPEGSAERPARRHRQVDRLRGEPEARDEPDEDFQRAPARSCRHDHVPHPGRLFDRQGFSRRQALRAHCGVGRHALHRLQLPRPAQHRPDAADLFADRIHSDQRTRHAAVHLQDSATPNTKRRTSSCSISARSRNISRRNTTTRCRSKCRARRRSRSRKPTGGAERPGRGDGRDGEDGRTGPKPQPPREIPVWEGTDTLVSREVIVVGPNGEKVDVMTFRGSFERDMKEFAEKDAAMKAAVADEDDDAVETIMNERFYHRPEMYYSPDKLVVSYGVPAPTPAFVYNAVGKKPLPTKDEIVSDTVDSIAARFNLRYNEQKWLDATAQLVADDPHALQQIHVGRHDHVQRQPVQSAGRRGSARAFEARDEVFEALRQSMLVRQSLLVQLNA